MHASREPAPSASRAILLETASAIMRDRDMVDVSLSELSQRSGLNSALVKYHFGNKAGLLSALLDRDWRAIVGETSMPWSQRTGGALRTSCAATSPR